MKCEDCDAVRCVNVDEDTPRCCRCSAALDDELCPGCRSGDSLIEKIHYWIARITTCPNDVQGQQRHFADVVPEAEEQLTRALTTEFDASELRTLSAVLVDHLGDDE